MQQVNLNDIAAMAQNACGQIDTIYLHWSAGHYNHLGPEETHYHLCITGEGQVFASTIDLTELKSHTWRRNTGAIGISILGCFDATTNNLGSEPPTDVQIEVMAQIIAVLCKYLELPIDYDHVRTHAEQADIDDYGPATTCERWDGWYWRNEDPQGSGGNLMRGKANFYLNTL
jgi:hypothetical protein